MTKADIIKMAMDWSNGDPELTAEIAVGLDRLYEEAYAAGLSAGLCAAGRASVKGPPHA